MKQSILKQIIKEEITSLLEGLEGPIMGVDHKKARSEEEASQLEKQGYQRVDKRNPSYKYRDEKGEYIPLVKKLDEKKKFPDLTGDGKVTRADILKARGVKLKEETNQTSQIFVKKLTPDIEKKVNLLKKDFPNYEINLIKNKRSLDDFSYTLSTYGKNTSPADNDKLEKAISTIIK